MPKTSAQVLPNLGVYLDRPPIAVDRRAMSDCRNVRVKNGRVTNFSMGYTKFFAQQLNGPVLLIDNFILRNGGQLLILGTSKDLYEYDEVADTADFLTPRYETGTVQVTNGSAVVTGVGTLWDTNGNLKAGDQFHAGAAAQRDPSVVWYTILSVDSDTQITLTVNYAEGSAGPGIDYTGRKLFTGDIFDFWDSETFPDAQPADVDHWYATNGVDYVVRWDGVADQVTSLSALAFKCKALRRFKNMLIYINLLLDTGEARPFSARNSAITFPENVSTLEAAEFIIHDGVDPLVGAFTFGNNLFYYGERSVTIAQFVGFPLLFAFHTSPTAVGPLNGRVIADFGDYHEFLSNDSLYRFDGVSIEEINTHVWREALTGQDPKRLGLAFSHFDEENAELHWMLPKTTDSDTTDGQPETSYVEHYLEEVDKRKFQTPYTIRGLPMSASGFFERLDTLTWDEITTAWSTQNYRWNDRFLQAAFAYNLFGDEDGFVYILNSGDTADGAAIASFARFGRQAVVDGIQKGLVKRLYVYTEPLPAAGYSLDVRVRTADQVGATPTVNGPFAHDLTHTGEIFVSPFVVGRFVEVELGTDGPNEPWTVQGYDATTAPAGRR